ncbi:hypothetical protein Tco_0868799 [Tanacetum coccineum]
MAEPILNENMENDQTKSNLFISSNNINIELNKEFLEELQKNTYHRNGIDELVNHIAKVLEMVDLIHFPGVDFHQLRMKVFPLSLTDDAWQWWKNKGMRSHGLTLERTMDTVMEEIYPELTLLKTNSIIRITNDDDDKSRYEQKRRWNTYTNYDDAYEINHKHNKSKELCEVHELPVCNIRRYTMIKYLFNDDEEYVAVKEDEYEDLTVTRNGAC